MCKIEDYFISYAIGGFWNYDVEGHWYEKEHTIVLDIPNREYLKMIEKYSKEKYSTGKPWFFFAYLPEKEDISIIENIIGEKIDERVSDYIQRYYNYSDSFNKQITLHKNEDFGFYNKVLMDEEYRLQDFPLYRELQGRKNSDMSMMKKALEKSLQKE